MVLDLLLHAIGQLKFKLKAYSGQQLQQLVKPGKILQLFVGKCDSVAEQETQKSFKDSNHGFIVENMERNNWELYFIVDNRELLSIIVV